MTEKYIQDAGHGGKDPGAAAKGNIEKEYTLEAALYVDRRLNELGIDSDLSRSSDVTLDENPRVNKVKQYKKGLSHHFNAGGGAGAEFIHSIYADGKFEHMLKEEFERAGYPIRSRPVFFRQGTNGKDYYFMHRRTGSCQMTIMEYDFVDGPNAEKIKNKAYREGMYECVVRAVCRREGVSYNKEVKKQSVEEDSADGKLTRGEKGPNVQILNNMLYELGHTQAVNKDKKLFDGVTLNALHAFLKRAELPKQDHYTSKIGEVMLKEIEKMDKEKGAIYRVQVGAFSSEKNAEELAVQLKTEGFNTYIVKE